MALAMPLFRILLADGTRNWPLLWGHLAPACAVSFQVAYLFAAVCFVRTVNIEIAYTSLYCFFAIIPGIPLTVHGSVNLLARLSGPWHNALAKSAWTAFAAGVASALLYALSFTRIINGTGADELMPLSFGLAGLVASAFTVGVIGLTAVRRLYEACSVDDDRCRRRWHSEGST